jgi:hypothetical protein
MDVEGFGARLSTVSEGRLDASIGEITYSNTSIHNLVPKAIRVSIEKTSILSSHHSEGGSKMSPRNVLKQKKSELVMDEQHQR